MRHKALRLSLLALIFVGFGLGLWYRSFLSVENLEAMARWFEGLGWQGVALYLLIFAIAPVFGAPALILTFLGGILFGPLWGAILAIAGATIADSLGFLLARYVARDFVEKHIKGALARIKEGVEEEGWRFIAFLRLTPIFPFWLVSYAVGLTRIGFWVYAVTTFFCIIPAASAYAYLGYAGRQAILAGELRTIFIALAAVAGIAFVPLFVKRLRAARQKTNLQPSIDPAAKEDT